MKHKNKLTWLSLLLAAPMVTLAQQTSPSQSSYFSNALFNTLFVVMIMLLVLVLALSNSIKSIIQSDYFRDKYKKAKENTDTNKPLGLILGFGLLSQFAQAQTAAPTNSASGAWLIGGLDYFTFFFMLSIISLEVIVVILLLNILKGYTKSDTSLTSTVSAVGAKKAVKEKTLMDVFNDAIEIEKEEEILLDHNYDGIKELDNNLPPWWKYGFYLTILVAIIYLINYHISGTGDLQLAEYNKEMAAAKIQVDEYMRTSANNVDENTVKYLTEAADLNAGKEIFITTCVACHGKLGEGNAVGPNLTDQYWIHGGGIVDLFKTIKYGWPDKGMKSWKEDLSPVQMAQVASFIKSLQGSNPPNAKAAQGDLYTDALAPTDSSAIKTDSTKISISAAAIDTLKKK